MKFEVNKPDNSKEMKELTAIDCKTQDRTHEIVDKYKDKVQYDAATDCCKVEAKDFERIEATINSYNRMEEEKKVVFEEILKEKGPEEAAKAEKEFYEAFLPGGKHERKPENLKDALEDIRGQHFSDRRSMEEMVEQNKHYIKERYYLEADSRDVRRIREALNLPKEDGGLGFQYDEKRRQWFTYDQEDLEKAKKLMDKTRELEQGKSLDWRSLVRELQTLEKETAHEM